MNINNTKQRILQTSAHLFAVKGFDVLTMRDIATACNIKAPSLYNHFKDKQALYQACLLYVFQDQGRALTGCLKTSEPASQKLDNFIDLACKQIASDHIFRQLFIRELLVQEESHMQFLVTVVMADTCDALHEVFTEIEPNCDPHFLTTSLMGLLFFHFQINPLRPYLPGGTQQTQSLEYLATNIKQMIGQYFNDHS
jgi:AcrR family transcriptional regulator